MKLKFLGAAGTVTGSGYLLTSQSGHSVLIDLGMFQGPPEIEALNYEPPSLVGSDITGVVLTHAHLDHCGRLPILENMGFVGNVYLTPPTADLAKLTLLDSAKVAKEDHGKKVLYDKDQVYQFINRFKTVNYGEPFYIGDFQVTLRDAGHILGSASVEIQAEGQTIVFSGDLGNTPEDLTRPTETIHAADVVIVESTYGGKTHPPGEPEDIILSEISFVEKTAGTLLIPAFSLERTQELLHIISHLKSSGKIQPETAIFLDSPMAEKATNIYEKYQSFLNAEIKKDFIFSDPFVFTGLKIIENRRDSSHISDHPGAKVIIAGAGMMTGGRILGHAKLLLGNPTTRLLIVGYQGEGTLGREILSGQKDVLIDNIPVHINAVVSDTQVMSSHADEPKLIAWLKTIQGLRKLIITHGEDIPRQDLAGRVRSELQLTEIYLPHLNEELDITV